MIKDLLNRIFSFRINFTLLLKPFINIEIDSIGNYRGVNDETSREVPIIISISSLRENFSILPIIIYSLLNQSLKPDKIILWLDEEYQDMANIPYEITQFAKNGLEFRFKKNLGDYTKTIYAMEEFYNSIIVTVSDKIYYPANWLKNLYLSYISHPNDIHVHGAFNAKINKSFKYWDKVKKESANFLFLPLSDMGILYPPKCFGKEAFRRELFLKKHIINDNLWFWVMSILAKRKTRLIKNPSKFFIKFTPILYKNKSNIEITDNEIKYLMRFYKQNIINTINQLSK